MMPTLRQVLEKARKEACSRQTGQISAGMKVLARSGTTGWQEGRVLKTVTKGSKSCYRTTQNTGSKHENRIRIRIRIIIYCHCTLYNGI